MHTVSTVDAAITALIKGARDSGGATASALGIETPTTGYMVGGYVDSLIFDAKLITEGDHDGFVWAKINEWVNANLTLATKFSMFLGSWIDTETGEAYIDLSQHFDHDNLSEAFQTAAFHDELAIWDLGKNRELRTETI